MSIIDSVRKLAEKVGADTNGRTIADQLNIINKKLDDTQPGSRDIAEAISKFADKEDGTAILVTKTITENKTYKAVDDNATGYSSVTVNVPCDNNAKYNTSSPFSLKNLTSIEIPEGVTAITAQCFRGMTNLAKVTFPTTLLAIPDFAFGGCTSLTSVEIPSNIVSISNSSNAEAFNGCTNLTTITIHKAEDSITGAPWGATNATIIWDGE